MNRDALLAQADLLSRRYRLISPARMSRGPAGTYQGAAGGQSIDFHDYREYQPGDDLRRVDWRAYARTGTMHLKLFREEVSPVVELTVDTSASMGAYPGKEQATVFLAAFVAGAARAVGGRPVLCYGGARYTGGDVEACLTRLAFSGPGLGEARGTGTAAERPWRFWLSDFLAPEGMTEAFARQAGGALAFTPVWLLAQTERTPSWTGGRRLMDVETPSRMLDIPGSASMFAEYGRRLRRHEEQLAADASRHGGRLLVMTSPDEELSTEAAEAMAEALADGGVVTPAE